MAKNEFLPFGTATSANVLSADEYRELPARNSGFQSGVAKSKELNTAWRQASVIANVVAQFVADNSGQDTLDDGDTAKLLINLQAALKKYANGNLPTASKTARGITKLSSATDSNDETMAATPKAVKAVYDLANAKKLNIGTTAGTVAAGDDARIVNAISIKNTDVQLPGRLTGSPLASTSRVYANEAFVETDGNIYGTRWGGWLSSYIESRWNSANAWFDESPRGWHLDRATGMLMQWGHVTRTASSTAVNFYVAFPNHCACVFMTQTSAGGGSSSNILAQSVTATGFNAYMASSERGAFWLAIGF